MDPTTEAFKREYQKAPVGGRKTTLLSMTEHEHRLDQVTRSIPTGPTVETLDVEALAQDPTNAPAPAFSILTKTTKRKLVVTQTFGVCLKSTPRADDWDPIPTGSNPDWETWIKSTNEKVLALKDKDASLMSLAGLALVSLFTDSQPLRDVIFDIAILKVPNMAFTYQGRPVPPSSHISALCLWLLHTRLTIPVECRMPNSLDPLAQTADRDRKMSVGDLTAIFDNAVEYQALKALLLAHIRATMGFPRQKEILGTTFPDSYAWDFDLSHSLVNKTLRERKSLWNLIDNTLGVTASTGIRSPNAERKTDTAAIVAKDSRFSGYTVWVI